MVKFPEFLISYRKKAEALVASDSIGDIEFSGSTYQIQVLDGKNEAWAFLQLDPKGGIKDCFCSCETGEEGSSCVHIAAAYLRIYQKHSSPLHSRFNHSLWNKLCTIFADRLGTSPGLLRMKGTGQYLCTSSSGKLVFSIKAKGKASQAYLEQIIEHRQKETEETSLKFSNLPQEEIMRWREGRPSSELRYELSFWSDIAKWLMLEQDKGHAYKIRFEYSSKGLPSYIFISFPNLEATFYLSQANLPIIIPALATVESPLKVHNDFEASIAKITYDNKEGVMHIEGKPDAKKPKGKHLKHEKGIPIDNWLFIPSDGFYARDHHTLLSTPTLSGEAIEQALNAHYKVIEQLIEGTAVHEDLVKVNYHISFDKQWNLHVACHLFKKGDITTGYSRFFGEWAYLDNDGFYRLEDVSFNQPEITVPADEVSDFVSKNRSWLNTQEGFHTHLVNIENQIIYSLDEAGRLYFDTHLEVSEDSEEHHDFGSWVYIAGQGFFSKTSPHIALPLQPGVVVEPSKIALFIRINRDELQLVPHFFSPRCPLVKSGLDITLNPDQSIQTTPHYELIPELKDKTLRFFDDFVFTLGEGFYEIPPELRLPEHYREPVLIEPEDVDDFIEHELDPLRKYVIEMTPSLYKPKTMELVAESVEESSELGKGWEKMRMSYVTDRGKIPITKQWKAIHNKQRYLFSEAGLVDLASPRFNWLRKLHKARVDLRNSLVSLNTMEILRLDAFDEILPPAPDVENAQNTRQLLKELKEFKTPDSPDLTGLSSHLRPYQEVGVNWLWFLYHHRLSGLLCDDMGLGKTHQAMALLAAIINMRKKSGDTTPCHFLVICPTSVIYHWQDKLKEFLPHARVCTFHGIKRSLGDFQKEYDILLTSYGIWRNDIELLKQVPFEAAILDEVQIAKNYNSQVYSALLNVNAKMRIGLTGTPIENRLRELKSLFDVVLPHYMPDESEYRDFFVKPIEKLHDQGRKLMLSRFIKPFVVRRRKEDVLKDLPDKTEEIAHCALLPMQYRLYEQVLHQSRQRILDELKDDKAPIPFLHIFALLSALKQICNHPAVYYKQPYEYKRYQSGKWDLFLELLSEARESQQKVVIFSQYLHMLDIIEDHLNEHGIKYASIRGATINRGEQVRIFNTDPQCEVFVGSLHAAGLGIDLTGGSVVIHYDRWWNAARENQATDRVHRIGQKRGVQVFKLVTKGTFEERIDTLIMQKGRLMEEVVGADEQQFLKNFNREDIIQLLQDVDLTKDNTAEDISDTF